MDNAELWRLYTVEEMTARAIAESLGLTHTCVKKRLIKYREVNGLDNPKYTYDDGARHSGDRLYSKRDAEILRLKATGLRMADISRRLGVTPSMVSYVVHREVRIAAAKERRRLGTQSERVYESRHDTSGARCRCGLRLPCHDHSTLSADFYAGARRTAVIETT